MFLKTDPNLTSSLDGTEHNGINLPITCFGNIAPSHIRGVMKLRYVTGGKIIMQIIAVVLIGSVSTQT